MTADELYKQILRKKSFLCVGLDSDVDKLPLCVLHESEPIFAFNKKIVDATAPYAVAYKLNTAFYEAHGAAGWRQLEKTVNYIRYKYPDFFIIADAKRSDIGNTSRLYAEAFFKTMDVDAVTLSPYMGRDTVQPFLEYENRWAVLLALTSNASATDFETLPTNDGRALYEKVLEISKDWGNVNNIMYVVGATQASMLSDIRKIIPYHFLLIPGVGAQGGCMEDVVRYGINNKCGLLINSSRNIIFASNEENFAVIAKAKAKGMQEDMSKFLI